MKSYIQLLTVFFLPAIVLPVSAQDEWAPVGPDPIVIFDFAVLDSFLFASTEGDDGAVYLTSNSGDDWAETSENLPSDQTGFVALAVKNSDVYAAARFRGLYALRDGSETWMKVIVASDLQSTNAILFAGEPWNRTFLGGSRLKGTSGVTMSVNESSWTGISNGLPIAGSVYSLISHDSSIYAATGSGVYRLDFGTNSWVSSTEGLGSITVNELGHNGNYFFAATNYSVFRSVDGESWTEVNTGINTASSDFQAFAFEGVNTFVAASGENGGVYHSVNNGDSWVEINEGFPDDISINTLITKGPYLFAGSSTKGVYRREGLVSAVEEDLSDHLLNIYPNPNDGQFKVRIDHPRSLSGRVMMTDLLGRQVYESPLNCNGGNCEFNIQVDRNYSGLFFLRIEAGKVDIVRKVIIR